MASAIALSLVMATYSPTQNLLREMTATPPRRADAYGYVPETPAPQDTTGSHPVIEELRAALQLVKRPPVPNRIDTYCVVCCASRAHYSCALAATDTQDAYQCAACDWIIYTNRSPYWCDECQGPSDQPTKDGLCPSCAESWISGGQR